MFPLHELDGESAENDELIGTPKSDSESSVPSLHAIAAIVQQELQTAIGPLESKLTNLGATLSERMGKDKSAVNDQHVRLGTGDGNGRFGNQAFDRFCTRKKKKSPPN